MATRSHMSRMTIDVSEEDHKQLKTLAALLGKSMRELVVEWIHENIYSKPNKETLKAIKELEDGKGVRSKTLNEFWTKLGIDPNA